MRKKHILFMICMVFIMTFPAYSQGVNFKTEGYVRSYEGLRLRAQPALDASILTVLPYRTKVLIADDRDLRDNRGISYDILRKWTLVKTGDLEGWVFVAYLSTQPLVSYTAIKKTAPSESIIAGQWYAFPPFLAEGYIFDRKDIYEGDPLCYPTHYNADGSYRYAGFEYYERGTWRLSGRTIHEAGEAGFRDTGTYTLKYNVTLYRMNDGIYVMERFFKNKDGSISVDFLVKSTLEK